MLKIQKVVLHAFVRSIWQNAWRQDPLFWLEIWRHVKNNWQENADKEGHLSKQECVCMLNTSKRN